MEKLYYKLKGSLVEKEKNRQKSKERFKEGSKERLQKVISQKMKTTMIGAIAAIEQYFGEIWGIGLDEKDCTNEQLDWEDDWRKCREKILNNGNDQLRALLKELDLYEAEYKGKKTKMIPIELDDNFGNR